jgi:predicted  nucleic acid-binding Zn-ribbon protein
MIKEHERLLKSQADELEKLRNQMDSMRSKIVTDTKHRTEEVNKDSFRIKSDLDDAVKEIKELKGEIQKIRHEAKLRQLNLETRLKEDHKALLKEIEDRMEKNYKTLLRRVEDRVSNLRVT